MGTIILADIHNFMEKNENTKYTKEFDVLVHCIVTLF